MQKSFIGDMLITTGSPSGCPVRFAGQAWTKIETTGKFGFYVTAPCDEWNGYPFQRFENNFWTVFILGELYGESRGFPEFKALTGNDTRPLQNLNGHFLLVGWNRRRERLTIMTNRFGTLHAYYTLNNPCCISTSYISAAAGRSPGELDWTGIAGFFTLGFFPDDMTWHSGVKIFRPASETCFSPDKWLIEKRRFWDWTHTTVPVTSRRGLLNDFAELYGTVMEEMTREGPIGLPLSGGLDSRSTVTALLPWLRQSENRRKVKSFSYGYSKDSIELKIAGQIADKTGLPFHRFEINPYLFDSLDAVLRISEGFHDITQSRQHFVGGFLRRETESVLAAHWGDVWLDSLGLADSKSQASTSLQTFQYIYKKMSKQGHRWLMDNCRFGSGRGLNTAKEVESRLAACFNNYASIQCPDFRIKAFKTDQWSFRWTLAGIRSFQAASFPRLPFYDTRLTDFFLGLPSALVKERQFQVEYIKNYSPALARISWQYKGANLYHYPYQNSLLLPVRIFGKMKRALFKKTSIERNWEIQFFQEGGFDRLSRLLLEKSHPLHEYYAPSAIRVLLNRFSLNPVGSQLGYSVSMLLTFAAWLQIFNNRRG